MDTADLLHRYTAHVSKKGTPPRSVHALAKKLGIPEREFFEHFGSFEALEAEIWAHDVRATIEAVEVGEDWEGFGAEQKLLAFEFAFCDRILDARSFYLARFPRLRNGQPPSNVLRSMGMVFTSFAEGIVRRGSEQQEIACRGPLNRAYPHALFLHLLSVIEFNLADDSKGFERTDAYIEKSVKLAFDFKNNNLPDDLNNIFQVGSEVH